MADVYKNKVFTFGAICPNTPINTSIDNVIQMIHYKISDTRINASNMEHVINNPLHLERRTVEARYCGHSGR